MSSTLFDHIKQLHTDELFPNLVQLMSVLWPQMDSGSAGGELFTNSANEYKVVVYYGDALYRTKDYRRAERVYHRALSLKKSTPKAKRKSQSNGSLQDLNAEIDVKYQIHLCHLKLKQLANASMVLESIPLKHRNARINMSLGEIYRLDGNPSAVNCFKEVIKECPFAMTAILHLIQLDVKANDILNIVNTAIASTPAMAWLTTWIKAHAAMNSVQMTNAIVLLRQLYDCSQLKGNADITVSLAEAYYYNGDYKKAINLFKKAFTADPMLTRGLDYYASALTKENQLKDLETLANQLVQRSDTLDMVAEPWIVLSYYCFMTNKKESKSFFFAQKAYNLNKTSVEALLLKGTILSESKRSEAKSCYLEAHTIAPHRFEPIKCLTELYLANNEKQLAANMANMALKTLGHSPRTLTLVSTVLLTDSLNNEKTRAKQALEKAVKQDSTYLNAVYLLSNLYIEDKYYDKAIEMLLKAIEMCESNVKLHKLLSECYTGKNEHEKASHHRSIVTKLELSYRNLTEGSQRLEHQSHHSADNVSSTLDLEVEDIPPSDEDIDESETDVVWSDDNYSVT